MVRSMTLHQQRLATIGWGERHFAKLVRKPYSTVRRWLDGTARMPAEVDAWLDRVARAVEALPPPG